MKFNLKRTFLVKFKTMAEILLSENTWFDNYGNLCCADSYNKREPESKKHLTPSSFRLLGKLTEIENYHDYPNWAIDKQYEDIFYPNIYLRQIAEGNMSPEDMVDMAKHALTNWHATKDLQNAKRTLSSEAS